MGNERTTEEPQPLGWFPLAMTVLIGATRLLPYLLAIPYPWNFAPVGAMSLYGGARLRLWQALTLPLLLMFVTDLLIWKLTSYRPFDPWVYGSLAASVLLGRLLSHTNSPWRIGALAVVAAAQFFLVTNFGVWLASRVDPAAIPGNAPMMRIENSEYHGGDLKYANNVPGLIQCYVMAARFDPATAPYGFALPAFASDLFFSGLLFGVHYWATRRGSVTAPVLVRGVS